MEMRQIRRHVHGKEAIIVFMRVYVSPLFISFLWILLCARAVRAVDSVQLFIPIARHSLSRELLLVVSS